MKTHFLFLSISLITFACSSNIVSTREEAALKADADSISAIPICIRVKIDSIKKGERWNPPTLIHEYEYKGRKVYVTSAPCCDFFTTAVDSNCNNICAPAGGFTGRGDGKCPEFFKEAKYIRAVWKDERTK